MTAQVIERAPVQTQAVSDTRPGKYLTFRLGPEEFGIQVLRVREILGIQDITHVPGMPPHLKGVVNLRGKIILVVDLRVKFEFPDAPFTNTTCIIVIQVEQDGDKTPIGLIVDSVCEVLDFSAADIEDGPDFGEGVETPFGLGIAQFRGRVKVLLRIQDVLTVQELRGIADLVQQASHFPAEAGR